MNRLTTTLLALAMAIVTCPSHAFSQTDSTFTYQGSLADSGDPANGTFSLDFTLFDALSGGSQIGSTIVMNSVDVTDGLLTAELDYGASAFDNTGRWLEIAVNGNTLSPRQPITRSPYSIQTRGIFVDEDNNVGIGTSTPLYPLHVESDDSTAIFGHAAAGNGFAFGGDFKSDSTVGIGIVGRATASTGSTRGIFGESFSTTGIAIKAESNGLTGPTFAVHAYDRSTGGTGVRGHVSSSTGTTYGVSGISRSTDGTGVYGEANASTGTTYGVHGESRSTFGRGVYGEATAITGFTYGVYGESASASGRGVYGHATAGDGFTYGVYGRSESAVNGRGVFGEAVASSGIGIGVHGSSLSTAGRGVYGIAQANTGTTYGVYGFSLSTSGRGVFGEANASSGITYGGRFESSSTVGRGVFGFASANSGVNYGVVGHSNSSSGFDFWASGAGTNYGSNSSRRWKNNIEPISNPLRKLAQLRGVYYDWDEKHGGHHDVGMIAEEVGKVLPEIVNYEENGIDAIGMDYSKMTPLLVEAVNALRAKQDRDMTTLREAHVSEINEMRSQLADLQQIVAQLAMNQEKESR